MALEKRSLVAVPPLWLSGFDENDENRCIISVQRLTRAHPAAFERLTPRRKFWVTGSRKIEASGRRTSHGGHAEAGDSWVVEHLADGETKATNPDQVEPDARA
eukprot:scaffold4382_cov372-Pinguiococcus_pyrenoidosus.AAC.2